MIREAVLNYETVRGFSRIRDGAAVAKLLLAARMFRIGVLVALGCLENRIPMKKCMFMIKRFVSNQNMLMRATRELEKCMNPRRREEARSES